MIPHPVRRPLAHALALCLSSAAGLASAQTQQVVKPPVAQAWIDVATFGGLGVPGFVSNPMAALGGLFGGGGGTNRFGQTQSMGAGRFVDVTLYTRNNPQLSEATQAVPAGFLSPALKLQAPKETKGTAPEPGEARATEPEYEKPKGRLLLYWGCGPTVRQGQPRIVDFANATPADLARVFQARRATQRGTHEAVGRPVWPSKEDTRNVPAQASLVGEHAFSGSGVPEGFRFPIGQAQDLMPAIALKQADAAGATNLEWAALPTARAYFISAMGAKEGAGGKDSGSDMILWTSSEQPDAGFGLVDYQTNTAVDRWLKEQVLLAPQTTRCTIPKGVFAPGAGAMLRIIAYGSEMNVAYPPRPADPKVAWEPQWAAKVRVKSVSTAMLGMEMGENPGAKDGEPKKEEAPGVKDLIKGIFGR